MPAKASKIVTLDDAVDDFQKKQQPVKGQDQKAVTLDQAVTSFVKKKDEKTSSKKPPTTSPSDGLRLPSTNINLSVGGLLPKRQKALFNYTNKSLDEGDIEELKNTKIGFDMGAHNANTPEQKKQLAVSFNQPKEQELNDRIHGFVDKIYPSSVPTMAGTTENPKYKKVESDLLSGNLDKVTEAKDHILSQYDKRINDFKGQLAVKYGSDAISYAGESILSDTEKNQYKLLQDEKTKAEADFNTYVQIAAAKSKINPAKGEGVAIQSSLIGSDLEKAKLIPPVSGNPSFDRQAGGSEAALMYLDMEIPRLYQQAVKTQDPEVIKELEEKRNLRDGYGAMYRKLLDQHPDVGIKYAARYLGDILSEIKPNRVFTSASDVRAAIDVAIKKNPFLATDENVMKWFNIVSESEGSAGLKIAPNLSFNQLKPGLIPEGGVWGGIKQGSFGVFLKLGGLGAHIFGDEATLEKKKEIEESSGMMPRYTPDKIVYSKDKKAFVPVPNEDYSTWDWNSISYNLGRAVPAIAEWMAYEKVGTTVAEGAFEIGSAIKSGELAKQGMPFYRIGAEAKVSEEAVKASRVFTASFLSSYDENYNYAKTLVSGDSTLDEVKRSALASFFTGTMAAAFHLANYSPTEFLKSSLAKETMPDAIKMFEESNWQNLTKEQTESFLKDKLLPRITSAATKFGEAVKTGVQLGVATATSDKISEAASVIANPEQARRYSLDDSFQTVVDQSILMTALGLPGVVLSGEMPKRNADALYTAGLLYPQYVERIQNGIDNGEYDPATGNKMIALVKTMGEEAYKVQSLKNNDNLPLSIEQKKKIAVNNFRARAGAELKEKGNQNVNAEKVANEVKSQNKETTSQNKWLDATGLEDIYNSWNRELLDKPKEEHDVINEKYKKMVDGFDPKSKETEANDRYKKNIQAIGERIDIGDAEKEKLKEAEDLRHAEELSSLVKKTEPVKETDFTGKDNNFLANKEPYFFNPQQREQYNELMKKPDTEDQAAKMVNDRKEELKTTQPAEKIIEPDKEAVVQKTPTDTEPTKQEGINSLIDRTSKYNNMRANDPGKSSELNEIKLEAQRLGLKVNANKGFAELQNESGNKIQKINSDRASNEAVGFDAKKYSPETNEHIKTVLSNSGSLISIPIVGNDGRLLSDKQKESAIKSIQEGKPNNGAKFIYDHIENAVKAGGIELQDKVTGDKVLIPVDEYFKEFKEPVTPLTDDEILQLNHDLTEDYFNLKPEDHGQETVHSEIEPTSTAAAGEGKDKTGGGKETAGVDKSPAEKTEPEVVRPVRDKAEVKRVLEPIDLTKEQARKKINGVPADKIIDDLRNQYKNLESLINCLTLHGS